MERNSYAKLKPQGYLTHIEILTTIPTNSDGFFRRGYHTVEYERSTINKHKCLNIRYLQLHVFFIQSGNVNWLLEFQLEPFTKLFIITIISQMSTMEFEFLWK